MATDLPARFTVSSILSVVMIGLFLLIFGGCAYNFYNPNCDLTAKDKYNEFALKFESCANGNCETFAHTNIPSDHKIVLQSEGGVTSIELLCDGKSGDVKIFENTGLCSYSLSADIAERPLDKFEITGPIKAPYSVYSLNGEIDLTNINEDVCLVLSNPLNVLPDTDLNARF